MQKMLNGLVAGLNIILSILTIIVTPAMILASWLMSPDWTSGDLFQIRPMLHALWVIIANVTYFIYAVLLIFIALATIFNSDKYGYKQLLPKLALGILMVPLTWWFIQFIISLSTIVTASVINIPMDVVINYNKTNQSSWWTEASIPKVTKFENTKSVADKESQKCNNLSGDAANCVTPEKFIEKAWGMYSNLMLYSFAVFRFQDVKDLPTAYDKVKWITQIIHQGIIGAIMFIVYGLLVIALVFMLMMRAIKLWFYAIFSPLMTLKYVIGDGFFWGKENSDTFELKEFIGLAFVPALVGLALSFGLIIVSVMMKPPASSLGACSDTSCTIPLFGIPNNSIVTERKGTWPDAKTETTVSVGDVKYIFSWDVTSGTTKWIKSGLNAAGGIIGTIIIDIIALVFIWVAFMAAKNVSKAVKAAVSPFEELGGKIGKLGMSLPKYAPILPGGLSISGANKIASDVSANVESSSAKKSMDSPIAKVFGVDPWTKAIQTDVAYMKQAFQDNKKLSDYELQGMQKKVQSILANVWSDSQQGKEAMKMFATLAKTSGKNIDDTKEFINSAGELTDDGWHLLQNHDLNGVKGTISSDNKKKWKKRQENFTGTVTDDKAKDAVINVSLKGKAEDKIYNIQIKWVNIEADAKNGKVSESALKESLDKISKEELNEKGYSELLKNSLRVTMKDEDAEKISKIILDRLKKESKFKPWTDK